MMSQGKEQTRNISLLEVVFFLQCNLLDLAW